jgi:hypothetical protein
LSGRWRLAGGGDRVDRLLQAAAPDAALGKPGDDVDHVAQRPAQPVELPHHQRVARAELVRTRRGLWSAAGRVGLTSDEYQLSNAEQEAIERVRGGIRPDRDSYLVTWLAQVDQRPRVELLRDGVQALVWLRDFTW